MIGGVGRTKFVERDLSRRVIGKATEISDGVIIPGFVDPYAFDGLDSDLFEHGTLLSAIHASREDILNSALAQDNDLVAASSLMNESPDHVVSVARCLAEQYRNRFILTINSGMGEQKRILKELASISRCNDTGIQVHLPTDPDQVSSTLKAFGKSKILNDRTTIINPTDAIDSSGWRQLGGINGVIFTPTLSGKIPVESLGEHGIEWALATGGESLSMIDVMKWCLASNNNVDQSPRVSEAEVLYRATLAGANLLGKGCEIGSLEGGKRANFLVVETDGKPSNIAGAVQSMLNGDGVITAYSKGEKVYQKPQEEGEDEDVKWAS